jgi:DNA repair protein SbcC/Rad50
MLGREATVGGLGMLFERFLKKKRQDTDKPEDQAVLAERARHHEDPALRREATRRLLGLAHLRSILAEDSDAGVRDIAAARYRHLLCGTQPAEIALEERIAELSLVEDARVLDQVAVQALAPEVRRAAIERVQSQEVLALCAVQDPLAGNRAAAVERIDAKDALEQVVRQIGKRDKNVYRSAREKLRLIAEREERPLRVRALCEDLCQKVERLGRLEHWHQDRAILDHLDRQWADIQGEAEPDWRARYETGRERFLQAYGGHARETAARIAAEEAHESLHAERVALLDELAEAPKLTSEREIRALRERIATAWEALEALPPQRQRPLEQRYSHLMDAAEAAKSALGEERKRLERLRRSSEKAQKLLDEPKPLDLRATKTFLDQARALAADLPDTDETEPFLALLARVESRTKTQRKHAEQRLKQLPDKLAELEQHLAEGELKKADPLYQSLRAGLDLVAASGLPKGVAEEIGARLHVLAPQLRDLQHWRRWGADQHREGLCEEAEHLIDAELPLQALSERLYSLRMDWKGLEKTGPRAAQPVWDRFNKACEAVQERCRPFLAAQAAERESNRAARESVCDQIEDFLAKVDWERVDWKRVLRAERDTRHTWESIGPVEPRHFRPLEGRFRHALKQLDRRLDAERRRNQAMKQDLIRQIEALVDEPDLDAAIERTKALQREWHTTVPARHKDENKLWQTFRTACDAIFERRAALHQAHANELKEHLAVRDAICAEAHSLAETEEDPKRLAAGLHELERRWDDAQLLPIPRQNAGQLNERWRSARDTLRQRRQDAEDRQRRGALDLLQSQAELCERLELTLLQETEEHLTPEAAEQEWANLPQQQDPEIQKSISARFASALAAARDPGQLDALRRRYETNAARLGQLCLQLEILAGVETPQELAKQRMEFQVARLTERMVDGEEDPLQGSARLLREWYLCGPAPRTEGLDARFERIRSALAGESTDTSA